MKKINKFLTLGALAGSLFFSACSSDDNNNVVLDASIPEFDFETYDNGFFVLNEGNFGNSNSSVTFIGNDFSGKKSNIFSEINNEPMGDVGQSITFSEDYAFIMVNASNIIHVVNRDTFELVYTIEEGLYNPRYAVIFGGRLFVTNWGDLNDPNDDYIAVVNTEDFSVSERITIEEGPEKMLLFDGKIYVALQGGGGFNNKVVVIDAASRIVEATIEVGDVPNSFAITNDYLWVMCAGIPSWPSELSETAGQLVKINISNNEVEETFEFSNVSDHPSNFQFSNNTAYYTLDGAVYSMNPTVGEVELPTESLFDPEIRGLYGFQVRGNNIYIADAGNFTSNGNIYIYSLNGDLRTETTVGIGPNGFYFND